MTPTVGVALELVQNVSLFALVAIGYAALRRRAQWPGLYVGLAIGIAMGADLEGADAGFNPVTSVVTLVANTAVSATSAMLAASLYIELRNWKDGPQTRALGDIFA